MTKLAWAFPRSEWYWSEGETSPSFIILQLLIQAKKDGFSDKYLSKILKVSEKAIRDKRNELGIKEAWLAGTAGRTFISERRSRFCSASPRGIPMSAYSAFSFKRYSIKNRLRSVWVMVLLYGKQFRNGRRHFLVTIGENLGKIPLKERKM